MKILITGGSGDVARAIAETLRNVGHSVLTPDRNLLDVTDKIGVKTHMFHYKPDIVVNNAGYISPWPIVNGVSNVWEYQIEVNLIGTYFCSKYALEAGAKQIINIGSSAGAEGKSHWSAYCAAKAGVERFTESLHAEGHYATCIRLGRTETKMRRDLYGEEDSRTLLHPSDVADLVERIIEKPETYSGSILPLFKSEGTVYLGGIA
jgi:NAD(P)-dependent dehydrogenase (short-subunit alcohol dehydrogenase family)